MIDRLEFRHVDAFPEPAYTALAREAFGDYQPSPLLSEVLEAEAPARARLAAPDAEALRIAVFDGDRLVAWTCARPDGALLHMVNAGVARAYRRQGIYSRLVTMTLEHAKARGHVAVLSRHAANNNAVIIAKLALGFVVSGFEYSEVYGPLVRLTYLTGELRARLHHTRAAPIRPADAGDA
jgi:ribosomal protein S18 acetylase RimI-like enzyme